MNDNQPQMWVVAAITIPTMKDKCQPMPRYDLKPSKGLEPLGGIVERKGVYEYQIGATKRDLLNSFLTDKD